MLVYHAVGRTVVSADAEVAGRRIKGALCSSMLRELYRNLDMRHGCNSSPSPRHPATHVPAPPPGSEPLLLRADALDSREVFCVVNAMRMVRPGGTFRLLLAFTPQARTEYLEVLTVRCVRLCAWMGE